MIFQFLISSPHILQHYSNTIKRKIARANNEYCKAKKKKKKIRRAQMYSLEKRKKNQNFLLHYFPRTKFEVHLFTYSINYRQQRHAEDATTRSIERARESLQCKSGVDATERLVERVHASCLLLPWTIWVGAKA